MEGPTCGSRSLSWVMDTTWVRRTLSMRTSKDPVAGSADPTQEMARALGEKPETRSKSGRAFEGQLPKGLYLGPEGNKNCGVYENSLGEDMISNPGTSD